MSRYLGGANTRGQEPVAEASWSLEPAVSRAPKRRMRHVTCYDAALSAVLTLTANDASCVFTLDEIEALIRKAGHVWPHATIVKIVNRDLAGIGSAGNSPRSLPVMARLPDGGFRLL